MKAKPKAVKKGEVSSADWAALAVMPTGWFEVCDVPYTVRSPHYRCQRLLDRKLLEQRVMTTPILQPDGTPYGPGHNFYLYLYKKTNK